MNRKKSMKKLSMLSTIGSVAAEPKTTTSLADLIMRDETTTSESKTTSAGDRDDEYNNIALRFRLSSSAASLAQLRKSKSTTKENLNEVLAQKIDYFYEQQKQRYMNRVNNAEAPSPSLAQHSSELFGLFKQQNPAVFKEINSFVRKQNRLVNLQLRCNQMPKFQLTDTNGYFEKENEKLVQLIKSKNLKNRNFYR